VVNTTGPNFPTLRGNDFNNILAITAPPTVPANFALESAEVIAPATVLMAGPICPLRASLTAFPPFNAVNIAKPAEVLTSGILIVFLRRVAVFLRLTIQMA